jgi:hypothetical protein
LLLHWQEFLMHCMPAWVSNIVKIMINWFK